MENYYSSIVVLSIFIMLILITAVYTNSKMRKSNKHKGLISAFLLVIIGIVCEWTCMKLPNCLFTSVLELIKFMFLPMIPLIVSKTIFEEEELEPVYEIKFKTYNRIICELIRFFIRLKNYFMSSKEQQSKYIKVLWALVRFYIIFGGILIVFGLINQPNISRFYNKMMYDIYISIFVISTFYMYANAFQYSKKFDSAGSKIKLLEIMTFTFLGGVMQLAHYETKTCWITIAVTALFIYIYYNEFYGCIDALTGLLNHGSFEQYIASHDNINKKCIIVIMDVNDFKQINDRFGHRFGDKVLKTLAIIIKYSYGEFGKCYRRGGDEYAVIINIDEKEVDIDKINKKFINNLEDARKKKHRLPHVSYGIAIYDPKNKENFSLEDAENKADKEMFLEKEKSKKIPYKQ